jgi:hypothetical protein
LALVLGLSNPGHGGPVEKFTTQVHTFQPLFSRTYTLEFKAGETACVIFKGDHKAPLALYVYDAHGNCIGWDEARSTVPDVDGVEWTPTVNGLYSIEARNIGWQNNECKVNIR